MARSFGGSASVESVTADSERGGLPAEDPGLVQGPEREAVRRVWALLAAARVAGDTSQVRELARQVAQTLGLQNPDPLIEALQERFGGRLDDRNQDARAEAGVAEAAGTSFNVSAATGSLEIVSDLSARAAREGIAPLTKIDVLTLVLVWLVTIGAPVLQQFLPAEDQAVMSNEYVTAAVGLAITTIILGRKR